MRRLDDKFIQVSITGSFLPDTTLLEFHVSHSSCYENALVWMKLNNTRERNRAVIQIH